MITNKYLEIRTLDFGSFVYNITAAPVHGWISVLAPNKVKEFKKSDIFVLLLRCVSLGTENDPKIGDKKAIVLSALPNQRCAQTILAVSSRPPVGKVQIQCQRPIRSRYLCQNCQRPLHWVSWFRCRNSIESRFCCRPNEIYICFLLVPKHGVRKEDHQYERTPLLANCSHIVLKSVSRST